MKNQKFLNQFFCANSLELLKDLENDSIDVVLTDPPYFLDKLDNHWNPQKVADSKNHQVVKSLPAGMKFDRKQGRDFYDWYLQISLELFRVLKPGGFFFSFSSPRLYHRMACAIDDAGFEIRDLFMWLYTQNQAKAMGIEHFIDKMPLKLSEKNSLKKRLSGWKTPQIKSCFEPIAMAQKPTNGTYLKNFLEHEVGMLNTNLRIGDNMFPANVFSFEEINKLIDRVFLVGKPSKLEKGEFNDHKTVKPIALCEYLINLSAMSENAVILDPFCGSGTTALAAKKLGKNFIAIDLNQSYIEIAKKRLEMTQEKAQSTSISHKPITLNLFNYQAHAQTS